MQQKVLLVCKIYLFCIYFSFNNFNYPNKKMAILSNQRNSSAKKFFGIPAKRKKQNLFGFWGQLWQKVGTTMIKPPGSSSRLTCILCIFSFACPGCSSSCRQNSCPSKNGEQQGWEPPLPSQILSSINSSFIMLYHVYKF